MSDDIVTRLRNSFTNKDYPMLKDHCESCAIPKEFGGHYDNCLYDEAAYEIERLRAAIETFIVKTSDSHCTWQMENDAIEELNEAVRGEE